MARRLRQDDSRSCDDGCGGAGMSERHFDYYARKPGAHDDHDHDHGDHAHAPVEERDEGPPGEYEIMSRALQAILEQKGVMTDEMVRRRMELIDAGLPHSS